LLQRVGLFRTGVTGKHYQQGRITKSNYRIGLHHNALDLGC